MNKNIEKSIRSIPIWIARGFSNSAVDFLAVWSRTTTRNARENSNWAAEDPCISVYASFVVSFDFNFSSFFFLIRSRKKISQCAIIKYLLFILLVFNFICQAISTYLETWILPTSPNDIIREDVFIASPTWLIGNYGHNNICI